MSSDIEPSVLRPHAVSPANLQRAREQIAWVHDDALGELERRSLPGAAALSALTWGGGHLYVGDRWRGAGLVAALVGWLTLASAAPAAIFTIGFVAAGAISALTSVRKGRNVNRYVRLRNELALRQGPDPAAYRLLSAAAAVNPDLAAALPVAVSAQSNTAPGQAPPGRHAELIERLRKLAQLHSAGVLNQIELRERKLDLLQEAVPSSRAEVDDLLYELLPLVDEAVLDAEDFALIKQLGGV